ncbi:unnamed protein product [Echinostoma caproni]|uniref:Nanos-type domain-containing protein n=1 Tax=Echinostoma caproni TaxID=27848 RepID=A0A183A6L5_9TREM|nr:unnamed protein product [Echinostoma caproni]
MQKAQRFWYCTECTRLGLSDSRRRFGPLRWPVTNPSIFSSWSEGIPLHGAPSPNFNISSAFQRTDRSLCPQHYCWNKSTKTNGSVYLNPYNCERQQQHQQPRAGECDGSESRPGEFGSPRPTCLAAGYVEYYRRQGKLKSQSPDGRQFGRCTDSRNL